MGIEFEKFIKIVYEKWKTKLPASQGKHPDEEAFAAFVENKLSLSESAQIKEHIISCQECGQRLALSVKLESMPETEPPEKLLQNSQDLIDRVISGQTLEILLEVKDKLLYLLNTTGAVLVGQELFPAAVLRSRKLKDFKDEITILKDFQNIRVEIKLIAKESNNFDIHVAVKDKHNQAVKNGLRISLFKKDVELESYFCGSGKAAFEHVVLGRYTVEIKNLSDKLATVLIDIKGNKNGPG